MKKVFFSFAIATMMASLVACGGQSGQNAEGQDSTAVEAGIQEVELLPGTTFEGTRYTLTLPEGWSESFNCTPDDFGAELFDEAAKKKYAFYAHPYGELNGVENVMNKFGKGDVQEDITLGDYTWKVRLDSASDPQVYYLYTEMPEKGVMYVKVVNTDFSNAGIQTMLRTMKLLPPAEEEAAQE